MMMMMMTSTTTNDDDDDWHDTVDQYHMLRSIYPACLNILRILQAQRTFGVGCLNSKIYRHPNMSWFGANMLIWSPLRTLHPMSSRFLYILYIPWILWILWISCSLNDFNSLHSNSGEFFMSNSGAAAFSHSPQLRTHSWRNLMETGSANFCEGPIL